MKLFNNNKVALLAASVCLVAAQTGHAAVTSYSQDFDGLDAANSLALGLAGGDQYKIFADVWFGPVGSTFLYSYGVFSAPNGGAGFSAIAAGEGAGDPVTDQYLNIYSDYNNADQANGFTVNTSVFQEQTIDANDIGTSVTFSGTYKAPSSGGMGDSTSATGNVYVKTLDQNNGYATTNHLIVDTTLAGNSEWVDFSITLDLSDALLEGQLLQFGFNTTATNYENSGVYYDNLEFGTTSAVPVPAAAWLFGSALVGLAGIGRKRRA